MRRAGAEDIADIGAAGQVTHAEAQQPALELEILAHPADPHRLAVALCRTGDALEGGAHPRVRVLSGNAHLGRQVRGADMQHVDALDRGNRLGVRDRLRGLDHRHQQRMLVEEATNLGLRERGVAEPRPAAEGRAVAFRGVKTGFDDRPGLGGVPDMRHHDSLRAAIKDAGGIVRIVRGDPGDRRDPEAQGRHAYSGRAFERGRVVLEVDIDRIEAARRRNHRDIRRAQLVDPHAQHQFAGFQHRLGAVFADLSWHRIPPEGLRAGKQPAPHPRAQRSHERPRRFRRRRLRRSSCRRRGRNLPTSGGRSRRA
jgi:hypothetical protein